MFSFLRMFSGDIQRQSLSTTIRDVINVKEGEWRKVLPLWLISFFAVSSSFLVWNVIQATGIKRLGVDALPLLYLASSVAIFLGAFIHTQFSGVFKKTTFLQLFNLAGFACIALCWYFLGLSSQVDDPKLMYTYFGLGLVGYSTFISFTYSQIWTLINDVISPAQGKRLFPFLGVSTTVGGVVSGAVLNWLTPFIGMSGILLVACGFILAITPTISVFNRRFKKELEWSATFQEKQKAATGAVRKTLHYVRQSQFVIGLAGVILLQWLFIRLFEFAFAQVVDQTFVTEEAFTQFHGLFLIVVYMTSITFDLLFLHRILERMGLTRTLFLLSNIVTALNLAAFAFPIFAVIISIYFVDEVLGNAEEDSIQMLTSVIPDDYRSLIASFLDGVVTTAAGILGSLFVLLLTVLVPEGTSIGVELRVITGVLIIVGIARFIANRNLQDEYFRAIEHNLDTGDLKTKQRSIELFTELKHVKRAGTEHLIKILKNPSEPVWIQEATLRALGEIGEPSTMRALITELDDPTPSIRIAAAEALTKFRFDFEKFYDIAFSRHRAIEELSELFKREPNHTVRAAALDALVHLENPDIIPFLLDLLRNGDTKTRNDCIHSLRLFHDPAIVDDTRRLLDDPSPETRGHAIVALWQFEWEREELIPHLYKMILAHSEEEYLKLPPEQQEEVRIGIKTAGDIRFRELLPVVRECLTWRKAPSLQTECALTMAKMGLSEGEHFIREGLESSDIELIERMSAIIQKNVKDAKVVRRLQLILEQSHLQYPDDLAGGETLNQPLGLIPHECLKQLEGFYQSPTDITEHKKIQEFLLQADQPTEIKGTVVLIEPLEKLRRLYAISLLAHGYDVILKTAIPTTMELSEKLVVIYDTGSANLPVLADEEKKLASRIVYIVGWNEGEERPEIKAFSGHESVVFRHHLSARELLKQIELKLRTPLATTTPTIPVHPEPVPVQAPQVETKQTDAKLVPAVTLPATSVPVPIPAVHP